MYKYHFKIKVNGKHIIKEVVTWHYQESLQG